MGIKDLYHRVSGTTPVVMKWSEPFCYRIRLRGDFILRLAIVLLAWLGATGILLLLFASNVNRPGVGLALGLGLVFGAGPGMLLTFFLRDHVSGTVRVREDLVERQRTYASPMFLTGQWMSWEEWPYAAFQRCQVILGQDLGQSFSVLMISDGNETDLLGVPSSIDVRTLAQQLTSKGVSVERVQRLPDRFTKSIGVVLPAGVAILSLLSLGIGSFVYLQRDAGDRGPGVARGKDRPDFGVPGPELPGPTVDIPSPRAMPGNPTKPADGTNSEPGAGFAAPPAASPPAATPPRAPFGGLDPSAPGLPTLPGTSVVPEPLGATPAQPAPARPSPTKPAIREVQSGSDSKLIGGTGGIPFRAVSPNNQPLLGVRHSMGSWAGQAAVRQLDPIFERSPSRMPGEAVMAPEGYAVGALNVHAGQFVNAVQLVFMRLRPDGRLDPADSKTSDWIGEPGPGAPQTLSGNGAPLIGIHGRRAAIFDAVGVVVAD